MSPETLHTFPEVQAKITEATKQLKHYQSVITERYHQHLEINLHVVVAVSFEKLLWKNIS